MWLSNIDQALDGNNGAVLLKKNRRDYGLT